MDKDMKEEKGCCFFCVGFGPFGKTKGQMQGKSWGIRDTRNLLKHAEYPFILFGVQGFPDEGFCEMDTHTQKTVDTRREFELRKDEGLSWLVASTIKQQQQQQATTSIKANFNSIGGKRMSDMHTGKGYFSFGIHFQSLLSIFQIDSFSPQRLFHASVSVCRRRRAASNFSQQHDIAWRTYEAQHPSNASGWQKKDFLT